MEMGDIRPIRIKLLPRTNHLNSQTVGSLLVGDKETVKLRCKKQLLLSKIGKLTGIHKNMLQWKVWAIARETEVPILWLKTRVFCGPCGCAEESKLPLLGCGLSNQATISDLDRLCAKIQVTIHQYFIHGHRYYVSIRLNKQETFK